MKTKLSPVVLMRVALGVIGLLFATACGSTGNGCCTTQPIPGGFPQAHRFDNAMQVRVSNTGIDFMENNFDKLVSTLVPGGLAFDIPPTGCSTNQRVCCPNQTCSIDMDITKVTITPTPQSTAQLNIRANVKTKTPIKFEQKILIAWINCNVTFDSKASGKPDLGLSADIDFVVDPTNNNKLKINTGNAKIVDFESGDVSITGGVSCTIASWFKSLFIGQIESQMSGTVATTVNNMLKDLPLGQESRMDMGSFMQAFSPRTSGIMDYMIWAGGYAQSQNQGMSIGVMGGFRAAKHNNCVPNCEKAGASCQPPQKVAISRSKSFEGNTRPDGKPFHVGIGIHTKTLDQAAYGMYSSGGLCLDVGTETVSQLSSAMFGLLVPSMNALTGGKNVPMLLAVRPRKPPTVELGKGTYHKDKDGNVVIDEPLLKIKAKDFAADVYVQLDERFVRLFTVVGDLEVPALLFPDADGKIQIILGSLTKSLTNITIENDDLITEDPKSLAALFPTILGLAASFLGSGLAPIELPAFSGIELKLADGAISATDNQTMLAIFANLAMVKTTSEDGYTYDQQPRAQTSASIIRLDLPTTAAFRVSPTFDAAAGPAVELALGATLPQDLARQPLEFSVRVDGGFWRPFTTARRLTLRDPLFWLQGHHTVEVMARVVGQPMTLDPTPVKLPLIIDTVPPQLRLIPTTDGVRAEVHDLVTPAEQLELSWSVNGEAFGDFSHRRALTLPVGTPVAIRVKDGAGNVASAGLPAGSVLAGVGVEPDDSAGGCAVAAAGDERAPVFGLLLLVALGAIFGLRRRNGA